MLYAVLVVALVVLDQVVKFLVRANIPLGGDVPFLPHILHLTYVQNTGAAFSIFKDHTWLLTIISAVVEAAIAAVRAGAVESELAAYVEGLYRQHGADRSGEGQLVCFGPNGADPHHAPNGTVLRDGDSVVLDIFIPIRRYWCDMTRTVFFRSVSDEGRRVYETVKAANLAAEAVIRPGVPMKDIDRAARKLIEDAGYGPFFTHRLGHGCGLDCHEPPDNSASSPAVAEPGMVFSVEPGIYLPGEFGVRIEDLVLVTETGCEVLNRNDKHWALVGQ